MKKFLIFTFTLLIGFSAFPQAKENYTLYVSGVAYPTNAEVAKSVARQFKLIEVKSGETKMKVAKFTIATKTMEKGSTTFVEKKAVVTGGKFNAKAIALVSNINLGAMIYIKDISITDAAGKTVSIPAVNFKVK